MSTYTDLDSLATGGSDITFACDLTGTDTCQTVIALQGNPVNNAIPDTGDFLRWDGSQWAPATAPSGSFSAGGDLSGSSSSQNVIRIQNFDVDGTAPSNNQVLLWVASNNRWEPTFLAFGGDLTGSYPTVTVQKLNGASVPTTASYAVGNVLQITNVTSTISYGPVNLAGGSDYVSGTLPKVNQESQDMAGDVSGVTSASTVERLRGSVLDADIATIGAAQDGYRLTWVNAFSEWQAKPNLASGVNWDKDLDGSDDSNQYVTRISGDYDVSNHIVVLGRDGNSILQLLGDTSTGTNAAGIPIRFYGSTANGTGDGGRLQIKAGDSPSGTGGELTLFGGNGSPQGNVTIGGGSIILSGFGTGVVHSNGSGVLSSSLIVNADINSSAAITVDKLAAGTAGQLLLNNSTPTPTWTTMSGDTTISSAGATTLVAIRGKATDTDLATIGSSHDGYVLTWVNGSTEWQAKPPAGSFTIGTFDSQTSSANGLVFSGGVLYAQYATATNPGMIKLAGDLGVAGAAPTVVSLTGGSGFVPIAATGNILRWAAATTAPGITQSSTSSGAGATMSITAQGATGLIDNGGGLALSAGSSASSGGGGVIISSGEGGGSDGQIFFYTGTDLRVGISNAGVFQITNLSTGLVHSDNVGHLTSSLLVDADVSASAAIDVSKLAAGTAGQVLLNNSTPTPTWTTLSQDIQSVSATGGVVVGKINGTTIGTAGGSLAVGSVLRVTSGASADWGQLDLADTDAVTGVLPAGNQAAQTMAGDVSGTTAASVVDKLKTKSLASALSTIGATQDGYVLTWINGSTEWQAKPAGGSGVTTVGTIDTSPNSNGLFISGTTISTQLASATQPGMVSTGTQTMAGAKTWSGAAVFSSTVSTGALTAGTTTTNNTLTGGTIFTTRTLAADLTIDTTTKDMVILCSTAAARNITLPAPVNGRTFIIKDSTGQAETNNITLIRNGSEKIEGVAASRILSTNWGVWRITTDGTDWFFL